MRKRKVVKYKRVYVVTVEGQSDTSMPDEVPFGLQLADSTIKAVGQALDGQFKHRSVTVREMV